jgi:hypothetical protein
VAETKLKPENLEERAEERLRKPRSGLSINDTVASNANLSVGARGVDTSGVEAGSGAGAGSTYVTATASGSSPAPTIVPGARGSGSTPRGSVGAEENASIQLDTKTSLASRDEISARAYHRWHQRGCPDGSPEVDWREAEEELKLIR